MWRDAFCNRLLYLQVIMDGKHRHEAHVLQIAESKQWPSPLLGTTSDLHDVQRTSPVPNHCDPESRLQIILDCSYTLRRLAVCIL